MHSGLIRHLQRRSSSPFRPPKEQSYCQHLKQLRWVYLQRFYGLVTSAYFWMKFKDKPDEGKLQVRFDEREGASLLTLLVQLNL
jgi:hypothetical protein